MLRTLEQTLLEILSSNDIYDTKLIPSNDSIIATTSSDDELDKIFTKKMDKELENMGSLHKFPHGSEHIHQYYSLKWTTASLRTLNRRLKLK